ncbi:PQQ-dependent sugar dehydrogenase [Pedobacter aquae]|uniref:PQQ-dependent sugar dehydrogenase n=1 Tax=Pedobacter aquae TaxID=2605747 RepID=UPI001F0B42D8|nr:sorbosone dehydrogenase family protein [Pedobacter aquae]
MKNAFFTLFTLILAACGSTNQQQSQQQDSLQLPQPFATQPSTKISKVIGWPSDKLPIAPEGFTVTKFATELENPRWIYQADDGNIFVAESGTGKSANRISLLKDTNNDGVADVKLAYLENLNQPFGMLVLNNYFYVANTDGLMRFPYQASQNKITRKGDKILSLPAGGYNNHWTRNIIASKDGKKIYISVGSGSNVGENGMEHEVRRACILEINPDGTGEKVFATGLRNPVGMDWAPGTTTLWTAVNERDNLGDDLVPDYITSVQRDGFYGWPYAYFGQHPDPRWKDDPKPELVAKAIVPEVDLGAHTASLGLAFNDGNNFPDLYKNAAFVGQHGSWNRSEFSGYKVIFVPFENGKPKGKPQDF